MTNQSNLFIAKSFVLNLLKMILFYNNYQLEYFLLFVYILLYQTKKNSSTVLLPMGSQRNKRSSLITYCSSLKYLFFEYSSIH